MPEARTFNDPAYWQAPGNAPERVRREVWAWFDIRDGKRVSVTSAPTLNLALMMMDQWLARDERGGRPDLHDLWPWVYIRRLDLED